MIVGIEEVTPLDNDQFRVDIHEDHRGNSRRLTVSRETLLNFAAFCRAIEDAGLEYVNAREGVQSCIDRSKLKPEWEREAQKFRGNP